MVRPIWGAPRTTTMPSRWPGPAGYTIEATDGNMDAWRQLWELSILGFKNTANYYQALGMNPDGTRNPQYPVLLDVDNLIDYMLMVFYDGDRDAPISNFLNNIQPNNWYGLYNRTGHQGFVYFVHDAEHILSRGLPDRTGPYPVRGSAPVQQPPVDPPGADGPPGLSHPVCRSGVQAPVQ